MDRPDAGRAHARRAEDQRGGAGAADARGLRGAVSIDGWSPLWTGIARMGGLLPPAERPDTDPFALLRGRSDAPGRGRADGGLVRAAGGGDAHGRPRFDTPVPPGGYAWWYVDAISDCGRFGLTIIGFIGSVFSPYYKASGRGDPLDHCVLNVALYGPRGARWAMTERPRWAVRREADHFAVGGSAMHWTGDALEIEIDERACPIPWPVRGRVRLEPRMLNRVAFALDPGGRHLWQAIAPAARISVAMDKPGLSWTGDAYFDSNRGEEALEDGFRDWQWSRAHFGREVAVLYEGERADRSRFAAALRFDAAGVPHEEALPPAAPLPRSKWLMARRTRADHGRARVTRTWEDSPFYTRSALSTEIFGAKVPAVHESLSLTAFASPIVQKMLPYRMPRTR